MRPLLMLLTGISSLSGFASLAGSDSSPTLLFEQVGGLGSSYTVSGVPLDLAANRYLIEVAGANWTDIASGSLQFRSVDGAAVFYVRFETGYAALYEGDNYNASDWASTAQGSTDLWAGVSGQSYTIGMEVGCGQAHVVLNGSALTRKSRSSANALNLYHRLCTATRPEPQNLVQLAMDSGLTATALRIYRREWANIHNLVLLGDSITSFYAAQEWDVALRRNLGPNWLINNQGVGYRQSREMKAAVLTPFPGDTYNNANVYPDVAGQFRSGAKANRVLGGIGTNDVIWYGGTDTGAGPECGGITAANVISNILGAIADIRSNNAGWKVGWRTVMNLDTFNGGGNYTGGEAMRNTINASIRSGSIAAACDFVIEQDNIFAPAASRTDGATVDGPLYHASYWPRYSDNPATFDGAHIHPTAICYQAIANYVAAKLGQQQD